MLKVYAAIWDDGDISLVLATSKEFAAQQLDILGDPTSTTIKQLPISAINGLMLTGSSGLYNANTGELIKTLTHEEALKGISDDDEDTYVDRRYSIDGEAFDTDRLEEKIGKCKKIVKVTTKDIYGD